MGVGGGRTDRALHAAVANPVLTMQFPTQRPPTGICVPVEYERARDGDTIEVRLCGGALTWAVRLIDCWCPELHRGSDDSRRVARAGRDYVNETLRSADSGDLHWFVPLPKGSVSGANILKLTSFDRLPGYLFIGSKTLNQILVERGFASTAKHGELGS